MAPSWFQRVNTPDDEHAVQEPNIALDLLDDERIWCSPSRG
jgi:hypothetical protein